MRERIHAPALRWQPPLASETRVRRQRILVTAMIGLVFSVVGVTRETAAHIAPRLLWNASPSVPIGLYSVVPYRPIGRGDIVVARLSEPVARLADQRHYLPLNVSLVKPVAALSGSRVCAIGSVISIDGHVVATRHRQDGIGRPLPWWGGCELLRDGRLFLLSPVADSFDSRYFGAVNASAIVGQARPVWIAAMQGSRP